MPKARVYEIAKEHNLTSKELIDLFKKNNLDVKSHTSTVDEDDANRIINQGKTGGTGARAPVSADAGQTGQGQQEQNKPADIKNSQKLNIWREDSKQDKMQKENLQKDVIRQKQQQAQRESQKSGYTSKGQYVNNAASDNMNSQQKTGPSGAEKTQRTPNQQTPQTFRSQQTNNGAQQTSPTQHQQRPQQNANSQQQRPQQNANAPQQQRSQYNSNTTQQRAQHNSNDPQQRPQHTQQRTQYGSGTTQQRTQHSSGTAQQRPQHSSGTAQQRTQHGSGTAQQRPQHSSGTAQQRPQYGSGTAQQRPQHSSGTAQQRPQHSSGTTQQRPQHTDSHKQRNPDAQKPTTAQKPQSNQKSTTQQRSQYNQKGQAQHRYQATQVLSIEKPNAPKKHNSKKLRAQKTAEAEQAAIEALAIEKEQTAGIIYLPKMISVKDLASRLQKDMSEIMKALMKRGIMANLNQEIDYYNAAQVAEDFELLVDKEEEVDLLEEAFAEDENDNEKTERSPVVVVMGHVDHGKTSLLDRIRKSNVTTSEAGGITQHIGAYTVTVDGKRVTFLDTPGHEAFTAMRMRGAQITDIAVLVVAADDGVMPQTIEAINHAKAANVEIIVAINKIDRPSANPDRVKQELSEHGLLSENWGGDTICVEVSAITGDGIDTLLEMITVVAEMKELKANANKRARGTVIEAMLDKGRGPVATVLVQSGTLVIGDPVVAGLTYGKIRAMSDDKGKRLKTAGPSMPVEILGLSEVPLAGDMFYVANNEKHARVLAESVKAKGREDMAKSMPKISLDDLFVQIQSGNVKDLNLVIKADVQGSVEAVKNSLERLSNNEVRIKAIHGGVGAITESDVMLASASNAIIIGFNVRPETPAKSVADSENVDIRLYRIIYNAIEDITAAMKGLLDPVFKEKIIGHAEIRQLFKASSIGTIAGSYITDGKFTRNAKVRIIRNSKVVYDGSLDTLKRFKDDVKEVNSGYECGLLFNKYNDIKEGDIVEAYIMEEIPR